MRGFFAPLRMTTTKFFVRLTGAARAGKNEGNSRFLHCAPHDETVRRFGRNDDFGVCAREEQTTANAETTAGPSTALLTKYVSNFAQDDRGF
jgi:hypothetical protein